MWCPQVAGASLRNERVFEIGEGEARLELVLAEEFGTSLGTHVCASASNDEARDLSEFCFFF